jgi:hypothetical protein
MSVFSRCRENLDDAIERIESSPAHAGEPEYPIMVATLAIHCGLRRLRRAGLSHEAALDVARAAAAFVGGESEAPPQRRRRAK